ncbi:bacterial proteasome activator family protein [Streptomyces sp. NPDC047028]|uniref:bacterial proteasome activator family protein n=1 Tax=Streptomyces sp. NPDC047028 TaxID=3155793 RepID=UPI0033ECACA6
MKTSNGNQFKSPFQYLPHESHQQYEAATDTAAHSMGDSGGAPQKESPDMVRRPAKIARIGSMIKQLLEEARMAPLDETSRARLKEIHHSSVSELEDGLSPELRDELERLSLPFTGEAIPTEAELRVAQAQLVGWLEGVFQGIHAALAAQHMATQAQPVHVRHGLPPAHSASSRDQTATDRDTLRSGPYL